ncbi:hypothetical protein PR002_g23450 [Phytophthora rubi]|uniref:Uncharacterized protein n=1 Tax=Phytophthora rubi TaxID=129364 RepID=A0A6A3IL07_9STRA|nr:hypothetical protein PR002_g23450 [Phytophthora rubi]
MLASLSARFSAFVCSRCLRLFRSLGCASSAAFGVCPASARSDSTSCRDALPSVLSTRRWLT